VFGRLTVVYNGQLDSTVKFTTVANRAFLFVGQRIWNDDLLDDVTSAELLSVASYISDSNLISLANPFSTISWPNCLSLVDLAVV